MTDMAAVDPGMDAELVGSVARLEAIRPQWLRLLERATSASPFVHPAFLLPWYRQAGQDGFRVAALAVWDGGELAALLPLSAKRSMGGLIRRLSPPLYGSTPPFDLIDTDRRGTGEAVDRFFDGPGWDTVVWPAIPARARAALVAERLRRQGHRLRVVVQKDRYAAELTGDWHDYLASLRQHDRKELGRCARVAERNGAVRYETFRPGDADLDMHLHGARTVIAASWKNSAEMTARGLGHLETMARSLAEAGLFQLHTLFVGGEPVAYLSEIAHGGRRYAFHIAYDGRHAGYSPGRLVLARAIRIAAEEGVRRYEFCGYHDYLRRLANASEEFCSIEIVNRNALSRARVAGAALVSQVVKSARRGMPARRSGSRRPVISIPNPESF